MFRKKPTSHPPVMMRAFLPGSGKKGSSGVFLPTRAAWGSFLLLVWRVLSLSLETHNHTSFYTTEWQKYILSVAKHKTLKGSQTERRWHTSMREKKKKKASRSVINSWNCFRIIYRKYKCVFFCWRLNHFCNFVYNYWIYDKYCSTLLYKFNGED